MNIKDGYPNPKVNAAIYDSPATATFTPRDYLYLAEAALDQAGFKGRIADVAFKAVRDLILDQMSEEQGAAHEAAEKLHALARRLDIADMESTRDIAVLSNLCAEARRALVDLVSALPVRSDHALLANSQAALLGATVNHAAKKIREWAATWRALSIAEETPEADEPTVEETTVDMTPPAASASALARAHFDLLRAIAEGAGHGLDTTPGVRALLDSGHVRIDELDIAAITPQGTRALAVVRPERDGTAFDHRSSAPKPGAGA